MRLQEQGNHRDFTSVGNSKSCLRDRVRHKTLTFRMSSPPSVCGETIRDHGPRPAPRHRRQITGGAAFSEAGVSPVILSKRGRASILGEPETLGIPKAPTVNRPLRSGPRRVSTARTASGSRRAWPALLIITTVTSAVTSTSSPRRTVWDSTMRAPPSVPAGVSTSSTSSIRAGSQEFDGDPADREGQRLAVLAAVEGVMADAELAQVVRAAALHEADVGAVVDNAGEIGVFEIDPDRQDMPARDQPAGEIGPCVACVHRVSHDGWWIGHGRYLYQTRRRRRPPGGRGAGHRARLSDRGRPDARAAWPGLRATPTMRPSSPWRMAASSAWSAPM